MEPQIVIPEYKGVHNSNIQASTSRLEKSRSYKDLSTIIICPTRGTIHAKVVQSWMGLIRPMNQKVIGPIFTIGLEVGEAYNQTIQSILQNPELSKWKYILTIEDDNMPPPDGLMMLYESIDQYDVVGGLYWTKGEGGQPMIYGNPSVMPLNFIPQMPYPNQLMRANGLGMGFNLWRISIFKDPALQYPWFKTTQDYDPQKGTKIYTQDLYFYENAGKLGYKFSCDTRVKVGHYDQNTDMVW